MRKGKCTRRCPSSSSSSAHNLSRPALSGVYVESLNQLITEAADLTFCGLYLRSQGRLFSAAATQMGRQRCRCCAASSDLMSTPSTVISSVLNRCPVALDPCQGDWRYDLLIAGGLQRAAIGESLIRLQLHSPIPPTLHSAGRRWLW